jgi:hypothetical protein
MTKLGLLKKILIQDLKIKIFSVSLEVDLEEGEEGVIRILTLKIFSLFSTIFLVEAWVVAKEDVIKIIMLVKTIPKTLL